ncbi:MAG TPA: N-acetylmuramoyl-L-alanine amidase [Flavisolibacter sp.]|jgi:N-acetylmuramoyl-L-alanine amidase|nr:N-acetylmuramoyl-L-alanine amidase [Flavisolibacter sp.]
MLKKTIILLPCIFLLLLSPQFSVAQKPPVKTIIIDPGHGGADPGAAGLISTEAQITLALSKKLGEKLATELPDIKVLFTRTTDIIPGNGRNKTEGLRYRANFANESKADLFISIHCNSAGRAPGGWNERRIVDYTEQEKWVGKGKKRRKTTVKVPVYETVYVQNPSKGTETFIWTAQENSHKEQLVGDHAEFASLEEDSTISIPENDPVFNALKLIYTQKFFKKSLKLAELVQQEFEKRGRVNRGVKQRNEKGIWVLHATGMPSILVEAGFISNTEEEQYMNSEEGQNEIVQDIINAIKAYIASLEQPKTVQEIGTVNNEK